MVRSSELENVIQRWYADLSMGNLETTERLFSTQQEGFLGIGTDPNEWWHDPAIITDEYHAMAKRGELKAKVEYLAAYTEGRVGWVMSKVMYRLPRGAEIPIRQSFILHQEDGEWKVVHVHGSVGVPNEEFGLEPK